MKSVRITCIIIIFIISTSFSYAQTEDDLDNEFLSDEPSASIIEAGPGEAKWEIFGYLQSLNQFNFDTKKKVDEFEIIKLEARGRLNVKYGVDDFYGKGVMDVFYYPDEQDSSNNNPHDPGRLEAQELYVGGGIKFRYKIGKQLFSWGTGDAFQVTNYLDQPDMREFLAVDKDDKYRGVFALSLKYLIKDFALEVAATPIHNRTLMPEGFWELEPADANSIPVVIREEASASDVSNASFVARGGGTIGVLDFHASYFNGINNNIVMKPELSGISRQDVSLVMVPQYERVHTVGLDVSFTYEKLAVRAESSFTPNMIGIVEPDDVQLFTSLLQLETTGGVVIPEISSVEKAPFTAYVVGADYNLWGQNGLVLVEWMQGRYLTDKDKYFEPFMTDLLLVRIEDKFFEERLEVEISGIIRPVQKEPGHAIMCDLTWDFQNGLSISTGCLVLVGNNDNLFEPVNDKDMVYLKAKMEF